MGKQNRGHDADEIVQSTLSELILFLMFGFLILLGSQMSTDDSGGDPGAIVNPVAPSGNGRLQGGAAVEKASSNLPVIVSLKQESYSFPKGFWKPSDTFIKNFENEAITNILKILRQYGDKIRYIEVIGHTDGLPVRKKLKSGVLKVSNLDVELFTFLNSGDPLENRTRLHYVDNAGLGLARATVVAALICYNIKGDFPDIRVLPYSAGQMVTREKRVSPASKEYEEEPEERYIEIRFSGPKVLIALD
jgi:hypothetical protein